MGDKALSLNETSDSAFPGILRCIGGHFLGAKRGILLSDIGLPTPYAWAPSLARLGPSTWRSNQRRNVYVLALLFSSFLFLKAIIFLQRHPSLWILFFIPASSQALIFKIHLTIYSPYRSVRGPKPAKVELVHD